MTSRHPVPTPRSYLAGLPADRREALNRLHHSIRKAVPSLKPAIVSGILGYGKFHYRYDSGREGDWFIVGISSRKHHISLYICAADAGGFLAEQHAAELGRVKVGRSCITFKTLDDLNLGVAMKLVKKAARLGGAGATP